MVSLATASYFTIRIWDSIYERSRYLELDSHACITNTLPTEPFFSRQEVFSLFCFASH